MAKIKLDDQIVERATKVADAAGYPSVEEFIVHAIEKQLAALESADDDEQVTDRLRGLGYLE